MRRQVIVAGEALHGLAPQVAVRHGVPDRDRPLAELPQDIGDAPRNLALAAAGPDGGDRDDRLFGREHRCVDVEGREPGPEFLDESPALIDVVETDVRVSEYDLADVLLRQERAQFLLGDDRYAVRVGCSGQFGGVAPVFDMRDLCRREGNNLDLRIVPVTAIEHVEVATRGPHDNQPTLHGRLPWPSKNAVSCYARTGGRPIRAST